MEIKLTKYGVKLVLAGGMEPGEEKCDAWIPCDGIRLNFNEETTIEFLHKGNAITTTTVGQRMKDGECLTIMTLFELRFPFNVEV